MGSDNRERKGDKVEQISSGAVDNKIAERLKVLPRSAGIYLFKDCRGRVLYIGKARDLRSRVSSYFKRSSDLLATRGPLIAEMINKVCDIDFIECESEVDALLQENRLIKDIQPPYNERLTDDKTFPYLEITTYEDFPAVYITREPNEKSRLFGPFVSVSALRSALQEFQKIFKFRTCKLRIEEGDPRLRHFRPCLLHSISQCLAPCAGKIGKSEYRKEINKFIRLLSKSRDAVLSELKREIERAANELRFEEAARLREQLRALEAVSLSGRPDIHLQPEVFFSDPSSALEKLVDILKLDNIPRIIEGFDVATLQGSESCGAMVQFIDGKPFKAGYRRFKIKLASSSDDYAMIRELIIRRYRRVAAGEELFPDLILIDGGLGHLSSAKRALDELKIEDRPRLVSLAKRYEHIYTDFSEEPIRLARVNPALKLLQYIRDEAHRFAQHYHHILRRKAVLEEDDSE